LSQRDQVEPVNLHHAAPTQDLPTPVESPAIVEFSAAQSVEVPAIPTAVAPLPPLPMPSLESTPTVEFSQQRARPMGAAIDLSSEPRSGLQESILAQEGTLLEQLAPAQPNSPIAQPAGGLEEQLTQLQQRQRELERQIDTLRQQLNNTATTASIRTNEGLPAGLSIYSQALFLRPTPSNTLDYAIADPLRNTALAVTGNLADVEYDKGTAIRIGLSYRVPNSGWDFGATHTFLDTENSESIRATNDGTLFSTLSAPFQDESARSARAEADFRHNSTDVELGYNFKVGRQLGVRFFGGLRYANVEQALNVQYDGGDYDNGRIKITNDFSGVGPRLGAEARVLLGGGFSLFGRGSGALLLGKLDSNFKETNNNGQDLIAELDYGRDRRSVPVVELAAGLDWSAKLGRSTTFNLSVGYEYQHWFNVGQDLQFVDASSPGVFSRSDTDLSLQGFFIKGGLTFQF
jgi:hypothetical protein